MACISDPARRKAMVQRVVRESIKAVDARKPPRNVTQDTLLGPSGLGHGSALRRRYHAKIREGLDAEGCRMKTLSPESFAAPALVRVRDVTTLVEGDLG